MILKRNFINVDDVEWEEHEHGEEYAARRKQLTDKSGAEKLGASIYEVPPGKAAWPRHYHLVNEEAIFVQSGRGLLHCGRNKLEVKEGDWVSLPAGKKHAHKLVNHGDEPLRYLCVSTMEEPEVIKYPDSDKVGVFAGSAPGGDKEKRTYQAYHKEEDGRDYWEDE